MLGIIFNPYSKKGHSIDRMAELVKLLNEKKIEYVYRESTYPGESVLLAKELAETCDTIVAAGGDGTILEILTGTPDANVTYAVFPLGSGNDVVKTLNINKRDDEEIIDTAINGSIKMKDRGIVNGKEIMTLFLGYGVAALINKAYKESAKASALGYLFGLLKSIRTFEPEKYTLIVDGKQTEILADSITIQNSNCIGSCMKLSPEADDGDGKFDVIILHYNGKKRRWLNMLALARGKVIKQPNIERILGSRIEVIPHGSPLTTLDGEVFEFEHAILEVMEKKAKFLYKP